MEGIIPESNNAELNRKKKPTPIKIKDPGMKQKISHNHKKKHDDEIEDESDNERDEDETTEFEENTIESTSESGEPIKTKIRHKQKKPPKKKIQKEAVNFSKMMNKYIKTKVDEECVDVDQIIPVDSNKHSNDIKKKARKFRKTIEKKCKKHQFKIIITLLIVSLLLGAIIFSLNHRNTEKTKEENHNLIFDDKNIPNL